MSDETRNLAPTPGCGNGIGMCRLGKLCAFPDCRPPQAEYDAQKCRCVSCAPPAPSPLSDETLLERGRAYLTRRAAVADAWAIHHRGLRGREEAVAADVERAACIRAVLAELDRLAVIVEPFTAAQEEGFATMRNNMARRASGKAG